MCIRDRHLSLFKPLNLRLEVDSTPLKKLSGKEKEYIAKCRLHQNELRIRLMEKRNRKCMLCGVDIPEILIASHIKSWRDSNEDERVDLENLLLLCAGHDALFDKGLISFDDDGVILISEKISEQCRKNLNITPDMSISKISAEMQKYMEYHRQHRQR